MVWMKEVSSSLNLHCRVADVFRVLALVLQKFVEMKKLSSDFAYNFMTTCNRSYTVDENRSVVILPKHLLAVKCDKRDNKLLRQCWSSRSDVKAEPWLCLSYWGYAEAHILVIEIEFLFQKRLGLKTQ